MFPKAFGVDEFRDISERLGHDCHINPVNSGDQEGRFKVFRAGSAIRVKLSKILLRSGAEMLRRLSDVVAVSPPNWIS